MKEKKWKNMKIHCIVEIFGTLRKMKYIINWFSLIEADKDDLNKFFQIEIHSKSNVDDV
jgi:hypothetical protein